MHRHCWCGGLFLGNRVQEVWEKKRKKGKIIIIIIINMKKKEEKNKIKNNTVACPTFFVTIL